MQVLANAQQYISVLAAETHTSRNGVKNNHPARSRISITVIIKDVIKPLTVDHGMKIICTTESQVKNSSKDELLTSLKAATSHSVCQSQALNTKKHTCQL